MCTAQFEEMVRNKVANPALRIEKENQREGQDVDVLVVLWSKAPWYHAYLDDAGAVFSQTYFIQIK
jgi:hypothetical protein